MESPGGTPESVVRAAHAGLPMIIAIIGGSPSQFKPFFDLYREEYKAAGHDPAMLQVGTHSHGLTGEEGDTIAETYFPYYAGQMDRVGRSRGWPPYTRGQYEAGRRKAGHLFIGDPAALTDKILYHQELFGLTRFLLHTDVGAPDHKLQMKSIELLGEKVIPEVKKALGKV